MLYKCTVYGPCSRRILEVFVNTSTEHVNSARYTLRCQRQSSQSECCICLFVSGPLSVCLSVHIFPPCDDLHKITDKPSSEFGGKNLTGQGRRRLDSVPQHFNVLKKLLMCVLCILYLHEMIEVPYAVQNLTIPPTAINDTLCLQHSMFGCNVLNNCKHI